ncbi:MAG TPA: cold shock domain-containing protein, partial [Rubrobacteraceae bacterium]|nr:cold shock domain-containing protein [Rubrobacteraceae bacterium]
VLDHGEQDGWGMWFDPAVADDPIWKEHWAGVESVVVKVAEDSIVLEMAESTPLEVSQDGQGGEFENGPVASQAPSVPVATAGEPAEEAKEAPVPESDREQGRVKWFDPEKGYGFLVRPTGDDLFVHHSEVEGDPSDLEPGSEVEYVVGRNDRGPNARSVRLQGG